MSGTQVRGSGGGEVGWRASQPVILSNSFALNSTFFALASTMELPINPLNELTLLYPQGNGNGNTIDESLIHWLFPPNRMNVII